MPHVDRSPVASGSAGSNGLPGSGSATGSSSSSGSAAGWSEEWSALRAALHNPAVWYMGCMKFLHDIAGKQHGGFELAGKGMEMRGTCLSTSPGATDPLVTHERGH